MYLLNTLDLWEQIESHRRAAAATASGKFKDEIIPVNTKVNYAVDFHAPFFSLKFSV